MARSIFIESPNAFYHVMSRGLNRQSLFYSSKDFNTFINLLRTGVKKFNIKIFAFCLMTNHYHIYLSTPDGNISKFMKFINQSYAQYYLKKYPEKDGHVFKGRYKRILVEDDKYSQALIAYVHNNPYKLTEDVADWSYSSYASYFDEKLAFDFVDYGWTLAQFSNDLHSFKIFHDHMKETKWNFEEHVKVNSFIGSDQFIKKVSEQYLDYDVINNEEVTGIGELKKDFDLEKLTSEISRLETSLQIKFDLQVYFFKELVNFTLKAIAIRFNRSPKSISKSNIKFKKKIVESKELQKVIYEIISRVN